MIHGDIINQKLFRKFRREARYVLERLFVVSVFEKVLRVSDPLRERFWLLVNPTNKFGKRFAHIPAKGSQNTLSGDCQRMGRNHILLVLEPKKDCLVDLAFRYLFAGDSNNGWKRLTH